MKKKNISLVTVTVVGIIVQLVACNAVAFLLRHNPALWMTYLAFSPAAACTIYLVLDLGRCVQLQRTVNASRQHDLNPTDENRELFLAEYQKYEAMK